ncbi:uncharacterized protein NPIL_343801 [Nephila pilipes]|uniref:Uncharacterized protein n=1 Tax=Nephila pilipes TaxID=299642 RepID=A0A8X6UG66_NEPPI|nr:uncharacterized protein NPIL_343801 [Nephila pilipes]
MTLKPNQPFLSRSINCHIYSHKLPRVSVGEIFSHEESNPLLLEAEVSIWRKFNDALSPSSSAKKEFSRCKIFLIQIRDNGISRDAALARSPPIGWDIFLCSFSIFSSGYGESNFIAGRWCAVGLFE